ncbi:NAD(P)-binding protein [Cytidiella melzeri]|nr:NAD(P)-binding protein [Cytidiella melzeri]
MSSSCVLQLFAIFGAAIVLKAAYDFSSFLYFHLLSPPKYHRYLYGKAPYALITGATDGIGKAVAKELYGIGFNLVLHGRNLDKLRKVQQEIKGSSGIRDVRLWMADASLPDVDFSNALKIWEDIEITLVFHNVGGGQPRAARVDGISEKVLMDDLRTNATFPWMLSRALLPKLRKASGPVELVFVGSFGAELPLPCYNPYGAAKAFLKQMSALLTADERFRHPTNVTTMYLIVGSVVSGSHRVAESLLSPTAESFAKHVVHKIGCGRRCVFAYVPHAVQLWAVGFLPERILLDAVANGVEAELKQA